MPVPRHGYLPVPSRRGVYGTLHQCSFGASGVLSVLPSPAMHTFPAPDTAEPDLPVLPVAGPCQPPCQWRINLARLSCLILLLGWIHYFQGPHIVQAIGQFRHYYTWILSHGQQHLAYRLRTLPLFHLSCLLTTLLIILNLLQYHIQV